MAVSVVGTPGLWFESAVGDLAEIPLNGGEAAGDRVFVVASWKDFSITATCSSNAGARPYTEITEFADGSVAAGNGAGSMKVGGWYKDWASGDDGPTVGLSAVPNIASGCTITLRKGASETWDTPLFATAAWPSSSSQTVSASSTIAVPNDSVVLAIIGIRDDSATFTRGATTGIDVASGITWNGNYVEDPASHKSTTAGGDMAADFGYRLVTTGGTVTLRATATISAAETGSVLWVVQSATAAAADRVPFYRPMTQLLAH
jgi:hypothetical protein